jgi:predicted kinase
MSPILTMNLTFKRPEYNVKERPMRTDWPRIVAFSGPAGSGKSTAAKHLVEGHGYRRIRFADPIKSMLRDLGLTFDQIDGPLKETPCDLLCGKTPRRAMQTLGDEWGRQLIGGDIWVRAWERHLEEAILWSSDTRIVVDDLRYPNELDVLLRHDALVVRVHRPSAMAVEGHASESHALFSQRVLTNDATQTDFVTRLEDLLDGAVQLPHAA